MLKDYKEEAETALKRCLEINENIVDNYISDPERQEFEEKEQEDSLGSQTKEQAMSRMPTEEQMRKAKLENEAFKEELESLRHLMVRYPDNLNYIRLYKEKEKEMAVP